MAHDCHPKGSERGHRDWLGAEQRGVAIAEYVDRSVEVREPEHA